MAATPKHVCIGTRAYDAIPIYLYNTYIQYLYEYGRQAYIDVVSQIQRFGVWMQPDA